MYQSGHYVTTVVNITLPLLRMIVKFSILNLTFCNLSILNLQYAANMHSSSYKTTDTIHRLRILDSSGATINDIFKAFQSTHKYIDGFLDKDEMGVFLNKLVHDDSNTVGTSELDAFYNEISMGGDGKGISFIRFIFFVEGAYEGKSPQLRHLQSKVLRVFSAKVQSVVGRENEESNLVYEAMDQKTPLTFHNLVQVFRFWDKFWCRDVSSVGKNEIVTFLSNDDSNDEDEENLSNAEMEVLFEFMREDGNGCIPFEELLRFLDDCRGDGTGDSNGTFSYHNDSASRSDFPLGEEADFLKPNLRIMNPSSSPQTKFEDEVSALIEEKKTEKFDSGEIAPVQSREDPEPLFESRSTAGALKVSPKIVTLDDTSSKPACSKTTTSTKSTITFSKYKHVNRSSLPNRNRRSDKKKEDQNNKISLKEINSLDKKKEGKKYISVVKAEGLHHRLMSHKDRVAAKLSRLRAERDEREKNWMHYEVKYRRYS